MKLCKDCKWYERKTRYMHGSGKAYKVPYCGLIKEIDWGINKVTGKREIEKLVPINYDIREERLIGNICGPDGNKWEPKVKLPWWKRIFK